MKEAQNQMEKPTLTPVKLGDETKVVQISGKKGMKMPEHHSTAEVAIVIKRGEGLLRIEGRKEVLSAGTPYIIPANVAHSLELQSDFFAYGFMSKRGEVEFE